jgi:hypothetical protein
MQFYAIYLNFKSIKITVYKNNISTIASFRSKHFYSIKIVHRKIPTIPRKLFYNVTMKIISKISQRFFKCVLEKCKKKSVESV